MGDPSREIALVDVVRPHANPRETVYELAHHVYAVVDAPEQNGLIADRNAGVVQSLTRLAALRRQFIRMIEMCIDVNRLVFFEHLAKFRRDSLRKYDGRPRTDANHLNVVDRPQLLNNVFEPIVTHQESITSGKQDIADKRFASDVIDAGVDFRLRARTVFLTGETTPRAMATIHGAHIGDEKKDAIGVAMR